MSLSWYPRYPFSCFATRRPVRGAEPMALVALFGRIGARGLPPLGRLGCAPFGKLTGLLFTGLARIFRQPTPALGDLIPGIPDALRVSELVNNHFHASEIAAGRPPYERAKRQFRPGRLSSPAALLVFDRHFRGLVDDGSDVPWLSPASL